LEYHFCDLLDNQVFNDMAIVLCAKESFILEFEEVHGRDIADLK